MALEKALASGDASRDRCLIHAPGDTPFVHVFTVMTACGEASLTKFGLEIGPVREDSGSIYRVPERVVPVRDYAEDPESFGGPPLGITVSDQGWGFSLMPFPIEAIEGCPKEGPTVCPDQIDELPTVVSAVAGEFESMVVSVAIDGAWPISRIADTYDSPGMAGQPVWLSWKVRPTKGWRKLTLPAEIRTKVGESERYSLAEAIEKRRSYVPPKPLDRDQVRKKVRAKGEAMNECFNEALSRNEKLQGRWMSRLWFSTDGKVVSKGFSERPEQTDKEFEACLLGVLGEIEIGPIPNLTVINYPFNFHAPD